MDDAERQRTMDFILQQQAQFAAGTHTSLDRLERVVVFMARRFRSERDGLRERTAALIDAQIKSEEKQSRSGEWQAQMEKNFARSEERMTRLEAEAERNRKDIAALTYAAESHDDDVRALFLINQSNSEAIRSLTVSQERNSRDIAALAKVVADMAGRRNGGEDSAQ